MGAAEARRTILAAGAVAAALSVACEKPCCRGPSADRGLRRRRRPAGRADLPRAGRADLWLSGRRDSRAVEGFLETMDFREGSFVRKGALLYTIDRKPLEASLASARADQATAEARFAKANNDVARYTPLAAKQAVSQQELDDAKAAQDATRSQVEATKAAVEKSTLDLSYTRVTAPIGGLVGITLVKPGNLVGRGQNTLLTTISQIDPIIFRVGVTEGDYLRVRKRAAEGGADAREGMDIQLTLADNTSVQPQRPPRAGRARGRSHDRHPGHPARIRQSRHAAAPRAVRPRENPARDQAGCDSGAAARRAGAAEPAERRRGRCRRQGGIPQRHGRPARRLAVGGQRRSQAGRTRRRRRAAADS